MSKENRKLVADALRSGEYKQGQGTLCRIIDGEPQYCCLGVACDVYIKNGGTGLAVSDNVHYKIYTDLETGHPDFALLPPVIGKWLGMTTDNGTVVDPHKAGCLSLVNANDSRDMSFSEIATLFEEAEFV